MITAVINRFNAGKIILRLCSSPCYVYFQNMLKFTCTIKKYGEQGEKTGWTYIDISEDVASKLSPGTKKSFRVKGKLDNYDFAGFALIPVGEGNFILPLNAGVRKALGKAKGAALEVNLELDTSVVQICPELMQCLSDEPKALAYFTKLPPSHQKYYSNWIESAKTFETKAKRIAQAVTACSRQQHYGEMIRSLKEDRKPT